MARSSYPAYEAEEKKRKQLDKGGLEFGFSIGPDLECPGLPECDEMNEYGKTGMIPANVEDGIADIKYKGSS